MSRDSDTTPCGDPCEKCGGATEFIPYQDAAGCGSAIIELWRCTVCGAAHYGDVVDYDTCKWDD